MKGWFFFFVAFFLVLFVATEVVSRKLKIKPENSRKVTHVVAGAVASTLPFFIGFNETAILTALFIPVMLESKQKNIFSSIHKVPRKTFGEVYFPLGILLTALFFHNKWEYLYGVLVMSLSDALASLLGQKYGKARFRTLNSHKTYVGSLVFFVTTLIIGISVTPVLFNSAIIVIGVSLVSALVLTLVESQSIDGLDNLLLPPIGASLLWLSIKLFIR